MILFIAITPAQLVNATRIAETEYREVEADLYCTSNLMSMFGKFINRDIYKNIFLIDDIINQNKTINISILKKIYNRFAITKNYKALFKSLPSNPLVYDEIFLSGPNLNVLTIYYSIYYANPKIKLNLFEEGLFEYCLLSMNKEFGKILYSKFFFHNYYLEKSQKGYFYEPKLVENKWKNISLQKIEKEFSDFYKDNENNPQKFIFVEQDFVREDYNKIQNDLVSDLASRLPKDNFYIKLHPRSNKFKYGRDIKYLPADVPLEKMAFEEVMNNAIFISFFSSAILNLKIVTDIEPTVILLVNLLPKLKKLEKEVKRIINDIPGKLNYPNFLVPKSYEEVIGIIENEIKEDNI